MVDPEAEDAARQGAPERAVCQARAGAVAAGWPASLSGRRRRRGRPGLAAGRGDARAATRAVGAEVPCGHAGDLWRYRQHLGAGGAQGATHARDPEQKSVDRGSGPENRRRRAGLREPRPLPEGPPQRGRGLRDLGRGGAFRLLRHRGSGPPQAGGAAGGAEARPGGRGDRAGDRHRRHGPLRHTGVGLRRRGAGAVHGPHEAGVVGRRCLPRPGRAGPKRRRGPDDLDLRQNLHRPMARRQIQRPRHAARLLGAWLHVQRPVLGRPMPRRRALRVDVARHVVRRRVAQRIPARHGRGRGLAWVGWQGPRPAGHLEAAFHGRAHLQDGKGRAAGEPSCEPRSSGARCHAACGVACERAGHGLVQGLCRWRSGRAPAPRAALGYRFRPGR
mmetsp:Transcript_31922/g.92270  ORF Transcript_31922/g.92270 Transcript_31922/m.92270 type:complete len:389 (-) Transcript_31922:834-2000(-)